MPNGFRLSYESICRRGTFAVAMSWSQTLHTFRITELAYGVLHSLSPLKCTQEEPSISSRSSITTKQADSSELAWDGRRFHHDLFKVEGMIKYFLALKAGSEVTSSSTRGILLAGGRPVICIIYCLVSKKEKILILTLCSQFWLQDIKNLLILTWFSKFRPFFLNCDLK